MATAEQPITRSELREELSHYATKEDLANMKVDLIKWLVGFQMVGLGAITAILKYLG